MAHIYFSQLCECGCGQSADSTDRRLSRRRRFLHGHQVRTRGRKPKATPPTRSETLCACGCGAPLTKEPRYLKGHNSSVPQRGKAIQPDDPRGPNPSGLCACGCGRKTTISTDNSHGTQRGCYTRFIRGHAMTPAVRHIGNPSGICKCGCGLKTPIAKQSKLGNIAGTPQMYYPGHRWRTASTFKVDRRTGCWIMPVHRKDGYSRIHRDGKLMMGHRMYWEERYGPIPEGLTLDHLCRVRACCNPDHMELCTQAENSSRVTHHPEIPKWGDWKDEQIKVDPDTGCWIFPILQTDGYARFWYRNTLVMAHRFYYRHLRAKIPVGLHLDHTCRNRGCVNPAHLEPVTRKENMRRAGLFRTPPATPKG
jgi:hypothetical protein